MRITNKFDLDSAYIRALEGGHHVRTGDLSVTTLLKPVQQILLMERYKELLVMDAADAMWMFLGTIGHAVMERFAAEGSVVERLLAVLVNQDGSFTPIEVKAAQALVAQPHEGTVVSCKVDHYADGEIADWKFLKVWGHIFGRSEEWVKQLSMYRVALDVHGIKIDRGHITEFLHDHVQGKAVQHDYPDRGVYKTPITMWPIEKTREWMLAKIHTYQVNRELPDDELQPCSAEERWARPDKFAVYKNKTVKKAARLLDSRLAAEQYISEHALSKGIIQHRPGLSVRCDKYCLVSDFCAQHKAENL